MIPESIQLSAASLTTVAVIVVVALAAVAMALRFRSEVLRARTGTESMNAIAGAIQEGAVAYLRRQFRTLGVFAVIAVVLLLLLDRKSTRLNSSHVATSYAVFCLHKEKTDKRTD